MWRPILYRYGMATWAASQVWLGRAKESLARGLGFDSIPRTPSFFSGNNSNDRLQKVFGVTVCAME